MNRALQGFVWFCLCVYLLHLQERTTRTRYLYLLPSLHRTVTFLLRTSSGTQRHSLLWRLIILENSGNQGSSSIGKHCPSQIMSRIGLLLVQKPFDTYLRIRIPWHPRLRMPMRRQYTNWSTTDLHCMQLTRGTTHASEYYWMEVFVERSMGKQRRTDTTQTFLKFIGRVSLWC